MQKFWKGLFAILFLFAFAFVTAKLFFEPELNAFLSKFSFGLTQSASKGELSIGVAEPLTSLEPAGNSAANRERLFNIYEGLVKLDKNLNIIPGLAVSYGSADDLTWEFRLRPGVLFHDGSYLSVNDVLASLNRAWKNKASGISDYFAAVASIEKLDESRFTIKTKTPDPLMLQKLASVMIFPASKENEILKNPVGTGPYEFVSSQNNDLKLKRFEKYWGNLPSYSAVTYKTLESRDTRKEAFEKGTVSILTDFPPEIFASGKSQKMKQMSAETLESNFLLFNVKGIFADKNIRKAASIAFDRKEVAKLGFGFARPLSQFAGNGIFGYDPVITLPETDAKEALQIVSQETFGEKLSGTFDLPKGLTSLGEYLKERFRSIGIELTLRYLSPEDLMKSVSAAKADLIFLGWRMELGDTSDFFSSVVHTRKGEYGGFNAGEYSNPAADALIEETQKILKPLDRLKKLRSLMKMIVEDDQIGIPLFSPDALYAVSRDIKWSPRIDGYVFAFEVK